MNWEKVKFPCFPSVKVSKIQKIPLKFKKFFSTFVWRWPCEWKFPLCIDLLEVDIRFFIAVLSRFRWKAYRRHWNYSSKASALCVVRFFTILKYYSSRFLRMCEKFETHTVQNVNWHSHLQRGHFRFSGLKIILN